ncbi:hypothetical protein L5515_005141 [Caenorhabditis briggsae]|uniref:Uncharacterized protein n=1 Tax=Caenorhabditis briggsae TaxID=6238 RepID=A0AAE9EPQ2_CAEBR|nr:hypothetical protein L5515_005141 [Caenorhabditis briggsae]
MNDSNRSSTISLHMIEDATIIGKDISETSSIDFLNIDKIEKEKVKNWRSCDPGFKLLVCCFIFLFLVGFCHLCYQFYNDTLDESVFENLNRTFKIVLSGPSHAALFFGHTLYFFYLAFGTEKGRKRYESSVDKTLKCILGFLIFLVYFFIRFALSLISVYQSLDSLEIANVICFGILFAIICYLFIEWSYEYCTYKKIPRVQDI